MSEHTEGKWKTGCGEGITGPTSPPCSGVTVQEKCQWDDWQLECVRWKESGSEGPYPPAPSPRGQFEVVGVDDILDLDTTLRSVVAFIPWRGKDGKKEAQANAALVAAAADLLAACEAAWPVLQGIYPTQARMVLDAIARAKGEA